LAEKGYEANEREDPGERVGECNALEFETVGSDPIEVTLLMRGMRKNSPNK